MHPYGPKATESPVAKCAVIADNGEAWTPRYMAVDVMMCIALLLVHWAETSYNASADLSCGVSYVTSAVIGARTRADRQQLLGRSTSA